MNERTDGIYKKKVISFNTEEKRLPNPDDRSRDAVKHKKADYNVGPES